MNFISASILFFFTIGSISIVSAGGGCPGGYSEGTTIDIGSYWYECHNGVVVPKGCLTEDHARIDIQETYDYQGYRRQCVIDAQSQLTLIYKSCVYQGREYQIGAQWDDGKSYFTCSKPQSTTNFLRIESSGCLDQNRKIDFDEKIVKDEIVYKCQKNSNGIPTLTPWGCAGKDGRQYATGESFDYGQFWYMCTANGDKVYTKCVGCLHEQRRLSSNDRYVDNDVIYECYVDDENTEVRPSGCVQRSENGAKIERRLGCFWIEGSPPYQYQMTCKHDKDSKMALKVVTKCVYKVTQGSYVVEPGCYAIADRTAIGCVRDSSDQVNIRSFQVDDNGQVNAPSGLRQC